MNKRSVKATLAPTDPPANHDSMTIDEKIAGFQKACIGQDEAARGSLLRRWFSPKEMSTLWGRLNTAVKQSNPIVKQKWQELKEKNQGREINKNAIKNNILMLKLTIEDSADWADRAVSTIEKMSVTTEASRKGEWYYRGELEQKLGQRDMTIRVYFGKSRLTVP